MPLVLTKVKVTKVTIERNSENQITITGSYELISEKGDTVAKQTFNGYGDMKYDFENALMRDCLEEIETTIEIEVGIQKALKNAEEK